jgi:hypothetical protein
VFITLLLLVTLLDLRVNVPTAYCSLYCKIPIFKQMQILLNFWKHQEPFRVTGNISCYVLLLLLLLLLLTTLLTSPFQLQLLTIKYE